MTKYLLNLFVLALLWSCTDVNRSDPASLAEEVTWINGPYVKSSSSAAVDTSFIDVRNQKEYSIVSVGGQIWMSQNLDFDTTSILSNCYDNNVQNCQIYGRMYDYENALLACPTGWHLPDSTEWARLALFAGTNSLAGFNLRADLTLWLDNGAGSDALDFRAIPAGIQEGLDFSGLGTDTYWWVRGELTDTSKASIRWITGSDKGLFTLEVSKKTAVSVRCVKDNAGGES